MPCEESSPTFSLILHSVWAWIRVPITQTLDFHISLFIVLCRAFASFFWQGRWFAIGYVESRSNRPSGGKASIVNGTFRSFASHSLIFDIAGFRMPDRRVWRKDICIIDHLSRPLGAWDEGFFFKANQGMGRIWCCHANFQHLYSKKSKAALQNTLNQMLTLRLYRIC